MVEGEDSDSELEPGVHQKPASLKISNKKIPELFVHFFPHRRVVPAICKLKNLAKHK